MALKFSMILEAIDRASAPAKKARASVAGLTAGVRRWGQEVRRMSRQVESGERSMEHFQRRARRLRQVALGSFFQAAAHSARSLANSVSNVTRRLRLMERAGNAARGGLKWMGRKALDVAGGAAKWGAAAATGAGGFALFDMFRKAGPFAQSRIAFKVAEGSAEKAKTKLDWISKFAAETPYELEEVIESFKNLQGIGGVDPTDGSLRIVGDTAAALSKDIMQVSEAYSDAVNGQFERLLELGLRASQQGSKVTFTYRKNGKAITKIVKNEALSLKRALDEIWSDLYAGSTLAQSKSLFGIISNIKDLYTRFLVMVADAGIFDKVKNKLQEWLGQLNALDENGKLAIWADNISANLEKAFDWATKFIEDTNWNQVGNDLKMIGDAVWTIARALGVAVSRMRELGSAMPPQTRWLLKGVGWVGSQMFGEEQEPSKAPATPRGRARHRQPAQSSAPAAGRGGWRREPQLASKPKSKTAERLDIGGETHVKISLSGPLRANVVSAKARNPNVPLVVRTGKIMAQPA